MAVVDKYVDANTLAGKKTRPAFSSGDKVVTMKAVVSVAAADDDGSIYRLFKGVPSNFIPVNICIQNGAVTAGTDYDLGLYKTGGAVVDKDILADGLDMSSARTVATWNNAGLTTVALANTQKTLAELSAQTDPDKDYDLALTANTVGSAAETIVVIATFVQA